MAFFPVESKTTDLLRHIDTLNYVMGRTGYLVVFFRTVLYKPLPTMSCT